VEGDVSDQGWGQGTGDGGGQGEWQQPDAGGTPPPAWGQPPGQDISPPPAGGDAGWQQQPPQPGWGAPGAAPYGGAPYGAPPQTNTNATVSLVLGIVSIIVCPLTGIVGIILGLKAKREIAASNGAESGEGMATGGIITSIVGLVFTGLGVLAILAITFLGSSSTERFSSVGDSIGGGSFSSENYTYGDDAVLDGLWDDCESGDMGACDDLYYDSPFGSRYEEFGSTCGDRESEYSVPC
jgi:hypothetical protein